MSAPYDTTQANATGHPKDEQGADLMRSHVEADLIRNLGHAPPSNGSSAMDVDAQQQQPLSPEDEQKRMDAFDKRFRRPQTNDPRDFHYVSPARWTQLRRDLEHCERTGKSPKTTLNNIAKVVDAGLMAETDEGCPAETACSECSKRQGVVCFAWRDSSKGRSCAYCKKQGISRCDAKQAEMRSEMERKVDAIAETVDLMLGELQALQREIRGNATDEDRARPDLPPSVMHVRSRLERSGRDSDDVSELDAQFDASRYSLSSHNGAATAQELGQQAQQLLRQQQHQQNGNNINPALDGVPQIHPLLNGDGVGEAGPQGGRGRKRPRTSTQAGEVGKRRATRNGIDEPSGPGSGNSSDNGGRKAKGSDSEAANAGGSTGAEGEDVIDPAVQAASSIAGFRPL